MKPVLVAPDVVVVDDVLDAEAFAQLGRELAHGQYASVHARGWDKAWRLGDGSPLRGGAVHYDPTGMHPRPGAQYPTATVVDELIDAVRGLAAEHQHVVGVEGEEWAAMFLAPWLYPVGSALSLHRDGGAYSGAFTYFAHPRWGIHWGGELLLLDEEPLAGGRWPQGTTGWMVEDEVGPGLATCVFPRPNRLVLVGPGRPHLITRVDPSAGDHVRTTLAGFFLRR
ncbi:MAG: hypothetical protein ACJ74O_18365 [Frankiaceae bacterium]